MRITENMLARNLMARTADALSQMAAAQEQISSGKKLHRPSDNPSALGKALALRADLSRVSAYTDNASSATAFMSMTESSMQEISDLLSRAKELMIAGANATSEGDGARSQGQELRSIIDSLLLVANRDIGGRSLFGGRNTSSRAYARVSDRVVYQGDTEDVLEEFGRGLRIGINITGPAAFQTVPSSLGGDTDLDPALSTITRLDELFDGEGAVPGTIRLTDGNGVSADVNLGGLDTIGQVIDTINGAGTAVVAAVSSDGRSIELTDTSGGGSFQVEDLLGGTLAERLGLATTSTTGTIQGVDLNPALGAGTAIALLRGGAGISAGTWTLRSVREGVELEATIDPSQANTVGDLLAMINDARTAEGVPLGIRAQIDGRGLRLESIATRTTISVEDAVTGGSAGELGVAGIGEAEDVFQLLERAASAVEGRDEDTLDDAIRLITGAVEQTAGLRGVYGSRSRQVISMAESLRDQTVDLTIRLADVEDADLAEAAIRLSRAETLYTAALTSGTRVLQSNLFDYIR